AGLPRVHGGGDGDAAAGRVPPAARGRDGHGQVRLPDRRAAAQRRRGAVRGGADLLARRRAGDPGRGHAGAGRRRGALRRLRLRPALHIAGGRGRSARQRRLERRRWRYLLRVAAAEHRPRDRRPLLTPDPPAPLRGGRDGPHFMCQRLTWMERVMRDREVKDRALAAVAVIALGFGFATTATAQTSSAPMTSTQPAPAEPAQAQQYGDSASLSSGAPITAPGTVDSGQLINVVVEGAAEGSRIEL